MLRIALPSLPPSVNALYANVPGKGRVKTSAYRKWIESAGWEAKTQIIGHRPYEGDVRVNIIVQRRGDADNRVKAILDLLTRIGVFKDDKQISAFTVQTGGEEGCVIEIELVPAKEGVSP